MLNQKGSIKSVVIATIFVIALVAFVGVTQINKSARGNLQNEMQSATIFPATRELPEFNLEYKASFTNSDLLGKWSVVFFGFTNCPGPCPATLSTMRQVFEVLESDDDLPPIQMVKITVDPARDDAQTMHEYLSHFDNGLKTKFIGLTGDAQHLADIRQNLGIIAEALPHNAAPAGLEHDDSMEHHGHDMEHYDIDHSLVLLIVSPEGQVVATSTAPHIIEHLINDLKLIANNWQ